MTGEVAGSAVAATELGGGGTAVAIPVVGRRQSITWHAVVEVGGVDVSSSVIGDIEVIREEGAAAVATVAVRVPGPYRVLDWRGRQVSITYVDDQASAQLFGGVVAMPRWDQRTRVVTLECSDQRDARIEALGLEGIKQQIGGLWHEAVYGELEGRSPGDYARERLETLTASAEYSVDGQLRVTSWFAKPVPDFVFGAGSTLADSFQFTAADVDQIKNVVEIDFEYRFPRRWQQNSGFSWVHPFAVAGGIPGFIGWFRDNTELPDRAMITDATTSAGLTRLATASWYLLPPTGVYDTGPTTDTITWRNDYYPNLLLGASWVGARRWVQPVTEQYSMRITVPASIAAVGERVIHDSCGLDVESELADAWDSTPFGVDTVRPSSGGGVSIDLDGLDAGTYPVSGYDNGYDGWQDDRDDAMRDVVAAVLFSRARADLVRLHRGDRAEFSVPTGMVLDVDLVHTVALDDQGVSMRCKVFGLRHLLSFRAGSAVTEIMVAPMFGGAGADTELALPEVSTDPQLPELTFQFTRMLGTQIGGYPSSPPHDPDRLGFSGNYSNGGAEQYPRQMRIAVSDISVDLTDEKLCPVSAEYTVGIPDDIGVM